MNEHEHSYNPEEENLSAENLSAEVMSFVSKTDLISELERSVILHFLSDFQKELTEVYLSQRQGDPELAMKLRKFRNRVKAKARQMR